MRYSEFTNNVPLTPPSNTAVKGGIKVESPEVGDDALPTGSPCQICRIRAILSLRVPIEIVAKRTRQRNINSKLHCICLPVCLTTVPASVCSPGITRLPIIEGEISHIEIPRTATNLGMTIVGGADTAAGE